MEVFLTGHRDCSVDDRNDNKPERTKTLCRQCGVYNKTYIKTFDTSRQDYFMNVRDDVKIRSIMISAEALIRNRL